MTGEVTIINELEIQNNPNAAVARSSRISIDDTAFTGVLSGITQAQDAFAALDAATTNVRQGSLFISNPVSITVPLIAYAEYPFLIVRLDNLALATGTLTLTIAINGTPVTGLDDIAVTTTPQTATATAANQVNIGDEVTLILSASINATNLQTTMKGTTT